MPALGRRSGLSLAFWGALGALLLLLAGSPAGAEDDAPATPLWSAHTSGLEEIGISSLQIHPKTPGVVLACVRGQGFATSTDEGKTWEVQREGVDERHVAGPRDSCLIALDPRDEKVLWLATKGHVYRSADGGTTWENKTTQALSSYSWDRLRNTYLVQGVVVDPTNSNHVYAGTLTRGKWRGGLFETTSDGDAWKQIAGDKREEEELHDAWPVVLDPRTDKNVGMGGTNGFWYSDERGRNPHRADPGDIGRHHIRCLTELTGRSRDLYACDGRGLWSSRDGGKRWAKKPLIAGDCVTVYRSPLSRKLLYAVLRDRGLVASEDARHAKWEDLGHADAEIAEILAHPRDKDLLYFASPVTGLHVSRDRGKTLEAVPLNVDPVVPSLVAVAQHPVATDKAMALTANGVVYLSGDRGKTWTRAGRVGIVPKVLFGHPSDDNAWYAAGSKLLKSVDNGATWESLYAPEDPEEALLEVLRLEDGTFYVLQQRARTIAWSADDGKTWKVTNPPTRKPESWATSFDVDRADPKHMLLATRSLARLWTPRDTEGGPWETWDGGKTWKALEKGLFEDKKPKREWNRGSWAAIDPATGVLFYAADGLGLFARLPADAKVKEADVPPWVDIGPALPNLRVNATVLRPLGEDKGSELVLQAEGANDTRTFVRTQTLRIRDRLVALAAAKEPGDEGSLWEELPDAPARLACLVADPHVDGRLLGCDHDGVSGVLVYGVPGARPASEKPPEDVPSDVPGGEGPDDGPKPPEGLLAFTGGGDGAIRVWGLAEGKVYSNLRGPTDEVLTLALAPDESVLAAGGLDKTVRLYDGADGKLRDVSLAPDKFDAAVNALAFHPDSKRLYVGLEQTWSIVEWNVETGDTRSFDAHTGGVLCVALTPDGKQVVSGSRDRTLRCWDVETAATVCKMDVGTEVLCLALSPDGKIAYVGGRGGAVRAYDVAAAKLLQKAELHKAYVSDIVISPDGTRLYVAGDAGLLVVGTADLKPVGPALTGPEKAVFCAAVSDDGTWIVGGDADSGLWLWRKDRAKPLWSSTTAHAGPIHCAVLTPDLAEPEEGAEGGDGDAPPPVVPPGGEEEESPEKPPEKPDGG